MNNFFKTKGELTVSIGEGYLSSFEASILKKGDIVKTSHLAGIPCNVFYNGNFICQAEIVILSDVFGIRVVDMAPATLQEPVLSNSDDVVEILPTMVKLGSVQLSIDELQDISTGSIISLGKPFSTDEDVELIIAGIPIAKGKAIVYCENFGIRITQMFDNHYSENNVRTTGFVVDKDLSRVKDYDFKRPDNFTRNAIIKIKDIHDLFIKNLKIRRNEFADHTVEHIDQCTFKEALNEFSKKINIENCKFTLIQNVPWNRKYENTQQVKKNNLNIGFKKILEEENTKHPLNKKTLDFIENFKPNGSIFQKPVYIISRKNPIMNEITENEQELKYTISCLRSGWKNFVDLNFKITNQYDSIKDVPKISDYDMVVIVFITDKKNPENFLYIIYPYFTLEAIIKILN